jgi:hypothetical protein
MSARQVTALVKKSQLTTVRLTVRTPGTREVRLAHYHFRYCPMLKQFGRQQVITKPGENGLLGFRFQKLKENPYDPYIIEDIHPKVKSP